MYKFRKEMARWRLVIHIPISNNFSDFFMTKCIRSPISLRSLYLKYPTLPYEDVYVILFCWISGIFFLLNCRNKSERIFAVLFCCLLGTRDGRCLQKQRVFGCCGNYFHSAVMCFCRPWFLSNLHLSYKWTFTPTSFKKSTEGKTKRKVVNNKPQHVSLLLLN